MGDDLITSPAYMAVPGNIYHTAFAGGHDHHSEVMRDSRETISPQEVFGPVAEGLVFAIVICAAWLITMGKKGSL